MAARHEECPDTYISPYFLVYEGLSNHDAGVGKGTVLQETRPGGGFKTSDVVKAKLGGGLPQKNHSHDFEAARSRNPTTTLCASPETNTSKYTGKASHQPIRHAWPK